MSNLALSTPFDDMGDMNSKLISALESSITALQAARQHQDQIAKLQASKADVREVRALRFEMAEVQGDVHIIKAGADLISTAAFAGMCRMALDTAAMQTFGAELAEWGREIGLPPRKELFHPGLNRYVNGHHPFALKLYCMEREMPVPTALLSASRPVNWKPPIYYIPPSEA